MVAPRAGDCSGSDGGVFVEGNVASLENDSGDPVKVGFVYNATQPTLADGSRVDAQADQNGNLRVVLQTLLAGEDLANTLFAMLMKPVASSLYAPSHYQNLGAAATATAKAAPGSVYSIMVTNANAAVRYVQLHNKASAAGAGETASASFPIPAGTAAIPAVLIIPSTVFAPSHWLSIGVTFGISTAAATYTAATAGEHNIWLRYV